MRIYSQECSLNVLRRQFRHLQEEARVAKPSPWEGVLLLIAGLLILSLGISVFRVLTLRFIFVGAVFWCPE